MTATTRKPTTPSHRLNDTQVKILQCLARPANRHGLTRDQLEKKLGCGVSAVNIGPSGLSLDGEDTGNFTDSLLLLGLVDRTEGETRVPVWVLTKAGLAAAATYHARQRNGDAKVPHELLDKVVRAFRITRTYGMECYTDADVKEVRDQLGKEYADVHVDDLRHQIANRRKQGAFADPKEKVRRACEKAIRDFGPDGAVLPGLLSQKQVQELNNHGR